MQTAVASVSGAYWQWRGHNIYYVKAGDFQPEPERSPDRPPLLLVHGFGASTDHWRKNIAGLSRYFEVWAIDLLGFGRSTKADVEYGGSLWRDQLHDFITEVIGRPVVLAGNSLGGYASLCVAAQRPESAVGLILLNCAGGFSSTEPPAEPNPFRKAFFEAARSLLLLPLPSWVLFQYARQKSVIRKTLENVYLDKSAVTDRLVEEIYRPSSDPGAPVVFAAVFKSPHGEKIDALLRQMTCPLLLLWGEGDPWMNARAGSVKYHQFYSQITEYFLQAGHCPHDEVPDQVNPLIHDWVLSLDATEIDS
jgi:pimeloyl-ACP methyl ester carboxylesterase